MNTKLGTTLLRSISRDILGGRPLWGMLRANEYLEPYSTIHRALAAQARRAFSSLPIYVNLKNELDLVLAGKVLSDLPEEARFKLLNLKEQQMPYSRTVNFDFTSKPKHLQRQAVLNSMRGMSSYNQGTNSQYRVKQAKH